MLSALLTQAGVEHTVVAAEEQKKAAGCIVRAEDTGRFLLALRSDKVDDPNVWGTFGGSAEGDERPEVTAEREFREETGYKGQMSLEILSVSRSANLTYATYLATVPKEFSPDLNWENTEFGWFTSGKWPNPQHYGLEKSLKEIERKFPPTVDPKNKPFRLPDSATGLYHATTIAGVRAMLNTNCISMSSSAADPTNIHSIQNPRAHFYYLSCSTSRFNPYARSKDLEAVVVLNADTVRHNNRVVPVDYWGRDFRNTESEQGTPSRARHMDEHEIRIVSLKPALRPVSRYVNTIHVDISDLFHTGMSEQRHAYMMSGIKSIQDRAETLQIKVYWYKDSEDFQQQVYTRAIPSDQVMDLLDSYKPAPADDDNYTQLRKEYMRKNALILSEKIEALRDYLADPSSKEDPLTNRSLYTGWNPDENVKDLGRDIAQMPRTALVHAPNLEGDLHWLATAVKASGAKNLLDFYRKSKAGILAKSEAEKKSRAVVLRQILDTYFETYKWSSPSYGYSEGDIETDGLTEGQFMGTTEGNFIVLESDAKDKNAVLRYWWTLPEDIVSEYNWVDWDAIASYIDTPKEDLRYMGALGGGKHAERAQLMADLVRYYGAEEFDHYPMRMRIGSAYFAYSDSVDLESAIDTWGLEGTYGYMLKSEAYRGNGRVFAQFVNKYISDNQLYNFPPVYERTNREIRQYPSSSRWNERRVPVRHERYAS